jgi:hypothetical protein
LNQPSKSSKAFLYHSSAQRPQLEEKEHKIAFNIPTLPDHTTKQPSFRFLPWLSVASMFMSRKMNSEIMIHGEA